MGFFFIGSLAPHFCQAQSIGPDVVKMEPPHWWNQGTEREFILILNGENLATCNVATMDPGLAVLSNERRSNPNFLFVRLRVESGCTPGDKALTIKNEQGVSRDIVYPIHDGRRRPPCGQGLESGATMYLIMPDRFANGDSSNDRVDPFGRHRRSR